MTLVELVTAYGYLAVFVGTLLEGETVLLLAGFAAHQGYLSIHWVLLVAFVGGTLGDQLFFWAGRSWGGTLLERFPSVRARTLQVGELLRRWDAALVVAIRFLYGLRIAGPIAMGALHFHPKRFAAFNAFGAAIWALLIGGAGYFLGHGVQALLGDIAGYETTLLWCVLALGAGGALLHRVLAVLRARAKTAGACGKLPPEV